MLQSRAPWLRHRPIGLMTRDGALHDVLRTYLERLAGPDCGSPAEAELLADNACNLIALLTARDAAEQSASQERVTDLERMFAFLRRHLSEPSLSPQAVADHMRFSVRTVHKRFEQAGITFRQWLLETAAPCLPPRARRPALRHDDGVANRIWRRLQRPVAFHQGVPYPVRTAAWPFSQRSFFQSRREPGQIGPQPASRCPITSGGL